MKSYEPKDTRYKHLESLSDRNGNNLRALFLPLWGNKAQLSAQDTKKARRVNQRPAYHWKNDGRLQKFADN